MQICEVGSLGKAVTTLVLLSGAPVSCTGLTLGAVASNEGATVGVHATKGELTAGTPGSLTGDWGKIGARGATVTWLAPWGGTAAPMPVAMVLGTFCGAGLEIISTWLPGPNPWGGTTKRALFRKICVPAARGVELLMTILCWTVLDAVNGAWLIVAVWVLLSDS